MNLLKAAVAASIVALATPAVASAADMSYSFVDLGWVQTDIDGVSSKLDGFGLRGSIGFADNYFAYAQYSDQSVSVVDVQTYSIGFGGHWAMSENLDFVAKLGWAKAEADAFGLSVSDDGVEAGIGLRGRAGEHLELEAGVSYVDSGGSGSTALGAGARWHFNDSFAVGLSVSHDDDATGLEAGFRFSF